MPAKSKVAAKSSTNKKASGTKGGKSSKTAAKPKASSNGSGARGRSGKPMDKELIAKVAPLKAAGKSPKEIAKALKIPESQALVAGRVADVKKAEQIKKLDANLVAKLRGEGLPWHTIRARAIAGGLPAPSDATLKELAKGAGLDKGLSGRVAGNGGPRKAGTKGGKSASASRPSSKA